MKIRNFGQTLLILVAVLLVGLAVVALVGFVGFQWYVSGYNKAVNLQQATEKAWADIDAAMQLNSYAKQFFGSFFCKRAGVKPAAYFQASEQARTEVPKVQF